MRSPRIRAANSDDLEDLIRLGEAMRRESWIYFPEIDRDHTRRFVETLLSMPEEGCLFIAEQERPVGFFLGLMGHFPFSPKKVATHCLWYVLPEYRASRAGAALMKAFERWSVEHGACRIRSGVETGYERLETLFERWGYERLGAYYGKWIDG